MATATMTAAPAAIPGPQFLLRFVAEIRAARPNWTPARCRDAARLLQSEAFDAPPGLEALEPALSRFDDQNPLRPRAACADEAQQREWRARWHKHRQLQRAV